MLSPSTGLYLNELITEMRLISETHSECKNARMLLSREISRVFDEIQKASFRTEPRFQEEKRFEAGRTPVNKFSLAQFTNATPFTPMRTSSATSSPFYAANRVIDTNFHTNPFVTPIKPQMNQFRLDDHDGDWNNSPVAINPSDCVLQTKIYIPEPPTKIDGKNVKCNYIGRILGPSGTSARMIERQYNVTLLIRGTGSVRNAETEILLKGKKGYEHLDEPLHVLLIARHADKEKCEEILDKAAERVESLLTPVHDEYKREQLVRFAIINGTYEERPARKKRGDGEEMEESTFG